MFERRTKPLLTREKFTARMIRCVLLALGLVAVSLGIGMAGYHGFEGLSWLDAFENAAMILSGMGPVSPVNTAAGKVFAGCYALYSGLALVSTVALLFAPIFHRFLHKFHLPDDK
jgi:hypothetical protein